MKRKSNPLKKVLYGIIAVIVIFVIGYIIYSVSVFREAEEEESGIVACDPSGEKCVIALHVHAQLDAEVCRESIRFPLEKGDLSKQHTHKEKNLIHWHDKLPYDRSTQTVLDWSPLKLGVFFEQMEMRFNSTCIGDYCNGDKCPSGSAGTLKMTVNGVDNSEFDRYIWNDQDKIRIVFG